MNILAFDTCFDACSACVAQTQGGAVAELASASERFETGHAERLLPMIEEVMARSGVTFTDLDRIAVTVGPGTFTGTRIGIAAARALSLATGLALVGASSLEVMAAGAARALGAGKPLGAAALPAEAELLIAVDARRGEVYAQLFDAAGTSARSLPQVLSIAQAAGVGSGPLVIAGSGAAAVAAAAQGIGRIAASHLPQLLPHATDLARIAAVRAPAEGAVRPLYLRAPDAKPQQDKSVARAPA